MVLAYRDLGIDPKVWALKRVIPAAMLGVVLAIVLIILLPDIFLLGYGFGLLILGIFFIALIAVIYPVVLRERKKQELDDELHLFIIRIAVLSLSSSTRSSIFEIASKEKTSKHVFNELIKVRSLAKEWNISLPRSLRIIAKQTPSARFGDFLERMAYAIESDEDPKIFFINEEEAVMEEFKSRYSTTLDRLEVVREVYISMVSVTMFLNVMLVVLSMLVGINHYLMSFLIIFIFIVVETLLWIVINSVLPKESIWYDPKPRPLESKFHRNIKYSLYVGGILTVLFAGLFLLFPITLETLILYIAGVMTPLLIPGFVIMREERTIIRRDEAFGAFIRTIGSTSESKGGAPSQGLKRIRWHDFGALTEQVKNLYDRLKMRIDSEKAWRLFVKETRSELISQFLNTYQEGIAAGGSPKEVSSLISGHFTTLSSLRKRRYLMADNFGAILYGLTIFISAGMHMIYRVVLEMLERLTSLESSSSDIENFQPLVLLKDVEGLEVVMLIAIILVVLLHVGFSADAIRRFKGSHPMMIMVHLPMLMWTAAISGFIAQWGVGRII